MPVKKSSSKMSSCPMCGGAEIVSREGHLECSRCFQAFGPDHFHAEGDGAMQAQTEIVTNHLKMQTIRSLAAYGIAAFFAVVSAAIVVFAPETREVAANLFAGAFLVLALGIAGFTRFSARAPGVEISGATDKNSRST